MSNPNDTANVPPTLWLRLIEVVCPFPGLITVDGENCPSGVSPSPGIQVFILSRLEG